MSAAVGVRRICAAIWSAIPLNSARGVAPPRIARGIRVFVRSVTATGPHAHPHLDPSTDSADTVGPSVLPFRTNRGPFITYHPKGVDFERRRTVCQFRATFPMLSGQMPMFGCGFLLQLVEPSSSLVDTLRHILPESAVWMWASRGKSTTFASLREHLIRRVVRPSHLSGLQTGSRASGGTESAPSRRAIVIVPTIVRICAKNSVLLRPTSICDTHSDENRCNLHSSMRRSWFWGPTACRPRWGLIFGRAPQARRRECSRRVAREANLPL